MNGNLELLLSLSLEKKYAIINQLFQTKSSQFSDKSNLNFFFEYPKFETHTLVFLYSIEFVQMNEMERVANLVYMFLIGFDPEQIVYAPKKFFDLVEKFMTYFIANKKGAKIIKPIYVAIEKIEHLGLTPLHNLYLQLCLRTKMYKEGLKLAMKPLGNISKKACNLIYLMNFRKILQLPNIVIRRFISIIVPEYLLD